MIYSILAFVVIGLGLIYIGSELDTPEIKEYPNRSQTKNMDDVDRALQKFDKNLHDGPSMTLDSCIYDRRIWVFDAETKTTHLRIYPGLCNV